MSILLIVLTNLFSVLFTILSSDSTLTQKTKLPNSRWQQAELSAKNREQTWGFGTYRHVVGVTVGVGSTVAGQRHRVL